MGKSRRGGGWNVDAGPRAEGDRDAVAVDGAVVGAWGDGASGMDADTTQALLADYPEVRGGVCLPAANRHRRATRAGGAVIDGWPLITGWPAASSRVASHHHIVDPILPEFRTR